LSFGNTNQNPTPVANRNGFWLDYFSFIWNPGVNGGTGTANANKSRYF
jgi:hypothetical protein